jgi:hypothetical protein
MYSFVTAKKPILIAVIFVLALGIGVGIYYFFPKPRHRDQIGISAELKNEITKYFNEKGRSVTPIVAYHCDSFTIGDNVSNTPGTEVRVILDKQPDQPTDVTERTVWVRSGTALTERATISGAWPCQW